MNGPRLTEERLRNYLDGNQPMRESMCVALLPLLGPYTEVRPRRPKGGPDGGRDLEAIHQGKTAVWGAVGFQNGGGSDNAARTEAQAKFRSDLDRAIQENPSFDGFVFFTNVDLTPGQRDGLLAHAKSKNLKVVDVFDFETLRQALDSPAGLLTRSQYLEIPASPEPKCAVVFQGFVPVTVNFGILYKMRFRVTGGDPGECRCDITVQGNTAHAKWDDTPNPLLNDDLSQFVASMVPATRHQRLYPDCDYQIPILIRNGGTVCVFDGWWFGRNQGYGSHPPLDPHFPVSIAFRGSGLMWQQDFYVRDIIGD